MIKVFMFGSLGRMGRAIYSITKGSDEYQIVAGSDIMDKAEGIDYPIFINPMDCDIDFDVIVDFSNKSAVDTVIDFALKTNKPLVCCTTGLEESTLENLNKASSRIPVFKSANMSYGMNILFELCKEAAKALYPGFDIEIVEAHHNRKLDAPSGTAYSIAESIKEVIPQDMEYVYDRHSKNEKRSPNEIGFSSIRGGNIVGEHDVMFISDEEILTISHSAQTRDVFAKGALTAAGFMVGKNPGFYSFKELIEQNLSK